MTAHIALRAAAAAGVLALVAGGAAGQVRQIDLGRPLDVNPRVGGGGANTAVPQARVNSQLYISGQVSGLAGFRGGVPYAAANELRLTLPSSALADFRARAVGASDVLAGPAYLTRPYYDPSRTVLGAPSLAAGRNVPGSNVPLVPTAPLVRDDRLRTEAIRRYEPLMGTRAGGALDAGIRTMYVPEEGGAAAGWAGQGRNWREFFNVAEAEQRARLAAELMAEARRQGLVDAAVDLRVDGQVDATVGEHPGRDEPKPQGASDPAGRGRSDQDVFLEMLRWQRQRQRVEEARRRERELGIDRGQRGERAPADATGPAERPEAAGEVPVQPDAGPGAVPPGAGRVEAVEGALVLHGLAGRGADRYNALLRQAEASLRAGRSYEAAERFQAAMVLDPANPLAAVGRALALLAAGEPVSAGAQLRRALRAYPPLVETRVDVERIANMEILRKRLAQLAAAADGETPLGLEPALIGAFVHHNLGEAEPAKTYAQALEERAKDSRLLRAYARYIRTGTPPLEQTEDEGT